jgi:hypothetical protein
MTTRRPRAASAGVKTKHGHRVIELAVRFDF